MKKYYVLALLLVGALTLVWCNKQEPIEINEPVVLLEEKPVEVVEEVVEPSEYCVDLMIESYRWWFDIKKSRAEVANLDLNSYETAIITAKFTEDFINNYRYEDSDKFFFWLKLFVWNHTDNGWYYNVLRARTEWLANWNYLTWLVPAVELKDWFTWTVPLKEDIYVANKTFVEWRQFIEINMSDYTKDSNYIWAYVSAVKELWWRELADINIKLCK